MNCDFCPGAIDVQQKLKYKACRDCRMVQKLASKNCGVYYDAKHGKYVSGDNIHERYHGQESDVQSSFLVLDLHNVVDLLTPNELADATAPLRQFNNIIILSFVGTTTETRIQAQKDMVLYRELIPDLDTYLCFKRGDAPAPGNKGHFIAMMQPASSIHFLDDHEDHIKAGLAAGATVHHVPDGTKAKVIETLQSLIN